MELGICSPEGKYGAIGWLGLAAFVAAWDILTPDSLTACFARGCKHPAGRVVVPALWGVTTAHLFGRLPRKLDPFYLMLDLTRKGV